MSEQLGELPIYRYDPKARVDEGEFPWSEGDQIECKVDGEVYATITLGPFVKTVDDEGELWSIPLLDVDIEGDE